IYPEIITPAYANKYIDKESNYAIDSIIMFEKLKPEFKNQFITKKPKMQSIHDYLCVLTNKQEYPEIIYDIPEDVINRFEMYCKNSKMKVLKKYSELLTTGNLMHNCSQSYRDRINKDHLLVICTNDLGKPIAELEIKNNAIVQAKLIDNAKVKNNKEINKTILDFAEKTKLIISTNDIDIETTKEEQTNAA
ncbi:MAG: PcfJ domain-containing protein, partial [Phascolarctobacterium sp.]|nr:PcfJ domain-containing protein [Phascolarctobacterium sp.]